MGKLRGSGHRHCHRAHFVVLSVCLVAAAPATEAAETRWEIGIEGLVGFPAGAFGDNAKATAYGATGLFTYRIGDSPFHIGAEVGLARYGSRSRHEPFSSEIPEVDLKVQTTNDILLSHFLFRVQPGHGRVVPFLDGLVGLQYLFTRSSVDGGGYSEPLASSTNFDDFAFSFGGAGGIKLLLYQSESSTGGDGGFRVMLSLRARYLIGAEADYLVEGSIGSIPPDEELSLAPFRSRTDLALIQMGVTFSF